MRWCEGCGGRFPQFARLSERRAAVGDSFGSQSALPFAPPTNHPLLSYSETESVVS